MLVIPAHWELRMLSEEFGLLSGELYVGFNIPHVEWRNWMQMLDLDVGLKHFGMEYKWNGVIVCGQ